MAGRGEINSSSPKHRSNSIGKRGIAEALIKGLLCKAFQRVMMKLQYKIHS